MNNMKYCDFAPQNKIYVFVEKPAQMQTHAECVEQRIFELQCEHEWWRLAQCLSSYKQTTDKNI